MSKLRKERSPMSKPLRNPKHEKFARAIVIDGKEPADAYVDAGFQRDRANHWKLLRNSRVQTRITELKEDLDLAARAARAPVADVLSELKNHGVERVADLYEVGACGHVVRDLRAVKTEIALALLGALHDGFGISYADLAALIAFHRKHPVVKSDTCVAFDGGAL
jgi:hypothetical protein